MVTNFPVLGDFWTDAKTYAETPAGMVSLFTGAALLLLLAGNLKKKSSRKR